MKWLLTITGFGFGIWHNHIGNAKIWTVAIGPVALFLGKKARK